MLILFFWSIYIIFLVNLFEVICGLCGDWRSWLTPQLRCRNGPDILAHSAYGSVMAVTGVLSGKVLVMRGGKSSRSHTWLFAPPKTMKNGSGQIVDSEHCGVGYAVRFPAALRDARPGVGGDPRTASSRGSDLAWAILLRPLRGGKRRIVAIFRADPSTSFGQKPAKLRSG
jgi:hypothetical protein